MQQMLRLRREGGGVGFVKLAGFGIGHRKFIVIEKQENVELTLTFPPANALPGEGRCGLVFLFPGAVSDDI